MKKIQLLTAIALVSFALNAQQQKKDDPLFDNWFANNQPIPTPPNTTPPPPANVPIDGGLIGLIAAGGALGYKKYKQRAESAE